MIQTYPRKQILLGSLICAIGALFYCYEFILRIVPGILQNELIQAFGHISASTFGEIAALYYFAYSPMQLPVGMLMDRFGPRRLLSLACLCCTIGSLMFTYSSSLLLAGSGRFLVGFGSAFAFVGVLTAAVNWLPPRFFSMVAGLITSLGMLGIIYGEVKITALVNVMSLSSVLMLLVFAGFVLSIFIFLVIRDHPHGAQPKQDTFKSFVKNVGLVLISKQVWLIGFIGAALYTSLSVFGELWGKSYLELAHHLSREEAATTISYMFLGWAIGAPVTGYISDHIKKRVAPLFIGTVLSLICIAIILYVPNISHSALKALIFLYGIFSGVEIVVFIMGKENNTTSLSSTVFAVVNMIVALGGMLLQPMVGALLDMSSKGKLINNMHIYTTHDYQIALSIIPVALLLALGAIACLCDKNKVTPVRGLK